MLTEFIPPSWSRKLSSLSTPCTCPTEASRNCYVIQWHCPGSGLGKEGGDHSSRLREEEARCNEGGSVDMINILRNLLFVTLLKSERSEVRAKECLLMKGISWVDSRESNLKHIWVMKQHFPHHYPCHLKSALMLPLEGEVVHSAAH